MSNKSGSSSQIIGLPQGGGALHGIGEKFAPDLHTGTGNFTVPIAIPAGRNGFQPQLSLGYSTGNGNGPFGLGWSLSVPGVMRKTSDGLPRYDDQQDSFVLSGAEDLVPVDVQANLTRYRPRTEGLFARIAHHRDANQDYWQVDSKDGLTSVYGTPATVGRDPAALADPEHAGRVFAWKLSQTRDVFGNRIDYLYERDAEQNDGPHAWDQIYLSEIRYADYGAPDNPQFLVRVKFVYETRPDPFSEYRAGFEIRTVRRCTQIQVYTQADQERLTRTYHLDYLDKKADAILPINKASLLHQVRVEGHDGEQSEFLPPLEFGYSRFTPNTQKFFAIEGPELPAGSLARPEFELADLFGNGLPDILEMNGTVRYWRNLGNGRFDWPRQMAEAPAGLRLADPGVQMIDADGDGRIDLMVNRQGLSGYFPLRFNGLWDHRSFQRYESAPSFDLEDPEVKLLDLTGDGVTDAIRSGNRLECFFNDAKKGWHASRSVERQALEVFPNLNFSDPRVKWGDFSGDGLQDVALVHDGHLEYWPNLGYGNWGKRISMRNSPRLPYGYDPKRILIDDIDGDGLADLVYVDDRKLLLWINQGGNGWSDPIEITGTPRVSDMDAVRLVDVLGNGNRGLLWSADADGSNRPHMFFLDFSGGIKPYVLNRMDNHLGSLTQVGYASSIRFYLEDQQLPSTRWQTPLPFPVQVVARVEVIDQISQGKLTTEYRYRHGYWDGAEREFRGFGRVDQRDSEVFTDFHGSGLHAEQAFETVATEQFSPPLETRTWFHQGPVGDEFGEWEELDFSGEYWPDDPSVLSRPQAMTELLKALPRREKRDALRALRGSVLRTELYALDGSDQQNRPYTVTEALQGVREEMPPADNSERRAIFFSFALAQRSTQWERGAEPMTQLGLMGDYDQYGRLKSQLSVAVPRGRDYRVAAESAEPYLVTFSETDYLQRDDAQRYLIDKVAKTSSYEIGNDGKATVFALWEAVKAGGAARQLIGQTLNFYDGAAFQGLAFGQLGDYGALVRSESLVMHDALLAELYRSGEAVLDPPEVPLYLKAGAPAWTDEYPAEFRKLAAQAGYVYRKNSAISAQGYFVITASHLYDFQASGANGKGRGLLLQQHDPLGRRTVIGYDRYQLLPERVIDPLGLKTEAKYDYRVLQPEVVMDANFNIRRFRFSPLGLLKATLVQGKANVVEGDRNRPSVELSYDLLAFSERGQPVSVRTRQYQHHDSETDVPLPQRDETIVTVEYSDGFGRLLQTRVQSEEIRFGDPTFGGGILPVDQTDDAGTRLAFAGVRNTDANQPNMLVSGWQLYDNKGRVVEKYEPFYAKGWSYAAPGEAEFGQKAVMVYDPRGQVIRTLNPDGSEQKVIYGVPADLAKPEQFAPTPWEAYTYDANDNGGRTHAEAAKHYQQHWDTPASIVIDALGRTITATARNGNDLKDWYVTRSNYDIRGNLLSVTDALGRVAFRYGYDLANRPWRTDSIDAGLRRTVLDAIGNPLEQRDSKGALTLHGYDEGNRPNRLWARDGLNQPLTLREVAIYGDRPDSGLSADAARVLNLLGKPYRHYDEAGLVSVPGYDFKGNPLSQSRQVLSDATLLSAYQNGAERNWAIDAYRVDWQAPAGTTLEAHAQSLLDPVKYETSTRYDALNRIKSLLYPQDVSGQRQELLPVYNRAGGLAQVKLNGEIYVREIAYSAKGQRVLVAYGNGAMSRYAYDPHTFRLLRLRTERYSQPEADHYQPGGEALQDFAYRYDLVGNILEIQDRAPASGILNNPAAATVGDGTLKQLLVSGDALLRQFDYDPIYRLLSATGRECDQAPEAPPWLDQPRCTDLTRTRAYSQQYRYDALGNMQELKHQLADGARNRVFNTVSGNNRLDTVSIGQSVYRYAYDSNGNMLSEHQTRLFDWDHGDRLKAFRTQVAGSEPSVHAQYLYDASGMRVKKLVRKQGGQYTVTVYVGGLFEYHRAVQGGTVQENNTLHVMDDQSRIALIRVGTPFPDDTTPAVKYHLGDHLGSSHVVIAGDGAWVNREEYTPYGETSFGSFARKRYRFTGKERDEESGLNYHAARYYAAWVARWVSCDPKGLVDGPNLYRYTRNNPVCNLDPSGTESKPNTDQTTSKASEINDASDVNGALIEVTTDNIETKRGQLLQQGRDAPSKVRKDSASRKVAGKNKGATKAAEQAGREARAAYKAEAKELSGLIKGLKGFGFALDALGFGAEFYDKAFGNGSPAQTRAGKITDAGLSASINTAFGMAHPLIAGADAFQEHVFGAKPVPISDTMKGATSAISVVGEAIATGNVEGVETLSTNARNNKYGWPLRLATRAGDWLAKEGGGAQRAITTGEGYRELGAPKPVERAAAFFASVPVLGHAGEAMGHAAGFVVHRATSDQYTLKPWKAAWWPF